MVCIYIYIYIYNDWYGSKISYQIVWFNALPLFVNFVALLVDVMLQTLFFFLKLSEHVLASSYCKAL